MEGGREGLAQEDFMQSKSCTRYFCYVFNRVGWGVLWSVNVTWQPLLQGAQQLPCCVQNNVQDCVLSGLCIGPLVGQAKRQSKSQLWQGARQGQAVFGTDSIHPENSVVTALENVLSVSLSDGRLVAQIWSIDRPLTLKREKQRPYCQRNDVREAEGEEYVPSAVCCTNKLCKLVSRE